MMFIVSLLTECKQNNIVERCIELIF